MMTTATHEAGGRLNTNGAQVVPLPNPNVSTSLAQQIKKSLRPRWMSEAGNLIGSRLKLGWLSAEMGLHPMLGDPLSAYKTSDTLYILGSGASINHLRPEDWAAIRTADSIGFNLWLLHDFVPSIYAMEIPRDAGAESDCLVNNLFVRRGEYLDRPILLKDGERHRMRQLRQFLSSLPAELHPNIHLTWDWEIPGNDPYEFAQTLHGLNCLGILTHASCPIFRKRAAFFSLVLLGLRAGYRRMVLCGVDLNNNDHFYESHREEYRTKGRTLPAPRQKPAVDGTNDPSHGTLTISRAIEVLDRTVLRPAGVELYVALRSSGLYPLLPHFFEEGGIVSPLVLRKARREGSVRRTQSGMGSIPA